MAIVLVNKAQGVDAAGTTNNVSATAINATTGNLLVAFARASANGATMAISDTAVNTWIPVVGATDNGGLGDFAMWYAKNITGNAANVVKCTWGANETNKAIIVLEYSGLDTVAPLDAAPTITNTIGGTSTTTSGAFTTAFANEVIIFAAAYDNGTALAAGLIGGTTGVIQQDTAAAATGLAVEDLLVFSPQTSITAAMSSNGAGPYDWLAQVATFKSASQPSGVSKLLFMGAG